MTVNLDAQYQDPDPEAVKWNSTIIDLPVFPTVMSQNVFHEKDL